MTLGKLRKLIRKLGYGKELPDAIYLHIDGWDEIPVELRNWILDWSGRIPHSFDYNLIKIYKSKPAFSLLWYPGFDTMKNPALAASAHFNRDYVRILDYRNRAKPPVLHKKRHFLPR